MNFLERLFFPWDSCCVFCRDEKLYKYGFCKQCFLSLTDLDGERCKVCLDRINTKGLCSACLKEKPAYEKLFAPKTYDGNMKILLHNFKYHNMRYLKHPLSLLMLDSLPKEVLTEISAIVPVASNKERIKIYGYNQALLLAKEISSLTGKKMLDILKKNSAQNNMHLLNKTERRKNIKNLYFANGSAEGETVLLVDDICTTGETLRACASLIKKAGAVKVYALTAARDDLKF